MKRLILPALAALTLGACETPQPMAYQPGAGPNTVGYSEHRIEPGRYHIAFHGARGAPSRTVEDFALRRAADLAVAEGYDWFRVYDRTLVEDGGGQGPRVSLGVGNTSFGGHSAVGLGLGTSFNLGGGPAMTASLEVLMGKGPRPAGGDVYDARGVQQSIGARI